MRSRTARIAVSREIEGGKVETAHKKPGCYPEVVEALSPAMASTFHRGRIHCTLSTNQVENIDGMSTVCAVWMAAFDPEQP